LMQSSSSKKRGYVERLEAYLRPKKREKPVLKGGVKAEEGKPVVHSEGTEASG